MGPLYHLLEEGVREAMRVLRPGGVLFAAFINRHAFIIDALVKDQMSLIRMRTDRLMLRLTDGIRRCSPGAAGGFSPAGWSWRSWPMRCSIPIPRYG